MGRTNTTTYPTYTYRRITMYHVNICHPSGYVVTNCQAATMVEAKAIIKRSGMAGTVRHMYGGPVLHVNR